MLVFGALLLLPFALVGAGLNGAAQLAEWAGDRRRRRREAIEAELDRKSAELRRSMLSLAEQLNAEHDQARQTMIREVFLATGQVQRPD